MPFVGVLAMYLYRGDPKAFFGSMGKSATFWFPLIALSLMGPFGVLARCLTVAHGSFRLLFPDMPLIAFSLIMCMVIFFVTMKKDRIVPLLGTFLTPFLLLSLAAITTMGYLHHEEIITIAGQSENAFTNGFFQGYQTMDLLAAFFFSTFILSHLNTQESNEQSRWRTFLKATLVGGTLLTVIYGALVFLGAAYAKQLAHVPPQEMFGFVAEQVLDPMAGPLVCIAVILACFTTAVVLATLYAQFIQTEISKERVTMPYAMAITLLIAFLVSTLEFAGIARFLGPILEALYPALIVLTLMNIATKLLGVKERRWPIALTLLAKLCMT